MPAGLRALERLGALEGLDRSRCAPFRGILYTQAGGPEARARFTRGDGLGVRRVALSEALLARAGTLPSIEIVRGAASGLEVLADHVRARVSEREVTASLLVGADGLQSQVRKLAGLEGRPHPRLRRHGLRRHFACAPWSEFVEVHWAAGVECYVTPVGERVVNVAFLWDAPLGHLSHDFASARAAQHPQHLSHDFESVKVSFNELIARFPSVQEHLQSAEVTSESRGAGPLLRPALARAKGRVALVGDAAGYVDAITGQGLSLAFMSAERLAEQLAPLSRPFDARVLSDALGRYHRSLRRAWLRYALPAQALLGIARRPRLRSAMLGLVARAPSLFSRLVEDFAG